MAETLSVSKAALSAAEREEGMAKKMTVLVLNSSEAIRGTITARLQEVEGADVHGYGVELPQPLTELVHTLKPHLVIMSWKEFGTPVLRELRRGCHPETQIWVYSGFDSRDIKSAAADANHVFDNYLVTPESLRALARDLARTVLAAAGE